jgi:hypothetical protein
MRNSANGSLIVTFKRDYMRRVISQAVWATDSEGGPITREFWKGCNIWNAVTNTGYSWAEIKEPTMHGCWKRLRPDLVQDFKDFVKTPYDAIKEVLHLMTELNLGASTENVDELIASKSKLMSNQDLTDIQEQNKTLPEAKNDDCQSPQLRL